MVNYNNGKIYKIEPITGGEEGDVYVGSTCEKYLCSRMGGHRRKYKSWKNGHKNFTTSFLLFDKYNVENCAITLLELVNAKSKDELVAREKHYTQSMKCVNKIVVGRTHKEYYQDNKEIIAEKVSKYHQDNKELILKGQSEYRKNNKEVISKRGAEYNRNNKEAIAKRKAEYRKNNKNTIAKYKAEYCKNNKEAIAKSGVAYRLKKKQEKTQEN